MESQSASQGGDFFMNLANQTQDQSLVPGKLKKAQEEKEKGNTFFKSGENKKALYHYNCVLIFFVFHCIVGVDVRERIICCQHRFKKRSQCIDCVVQ